MGRAPFGKDEIDELIESASSDGVLKHSIKAKVPNAKFKSSGIALGFLLVLRSAANPRPGPPLAPHPFSHHLLIFNSAPTAELLLPPFSACLRL